jgi:hypothetical protein
MADRANAPITITTARVATNLRQRNVGSASRNILYRSMIASERSEPR